MFIDAILRCEGNQSLRHLRMHLSEDLFSHLYRTFVIWLGSGETLLDLDVQCHIDQQLCQLSGIRLGQLFYNLKRSLVIS